MHQTDICNRIINEKTNGEFYWLVDFLFLPVINTFDSKAVSKKEGPKKFEEPDKKKHSFPLEKDCFFVEYLKFVLALLILTRL